MDPICLSPSILNLKLTPAEKILLARVCRQAGLGDGRCTDSNSELAQATAMHPQTISDQINRLGKAGHLQIVTSSAQANQRTLTPTTDLVADYKSIAYSQSNEGQTDYKPIAYSTPLPESQGIASVRICPVTGIDISHQGIAHPFATNATITTLFKRNRSRFDEVVSLLGLSDQFDQSLSVQCQPVIERIQRAVKQYESNRIAQPCSRDIPPRPVRHCPVTGVEITQHRPNILYATRLTFQRLQRQHPAKFGELVERLLPPGETGYLTTKLASQVRKLAKTIQLIPSDEQPTAVPISQRPIRVCPITQLDITHQGIYYPFVTEATVRNLFRTNPSAFDQLVSRLGLPDQSEHPMTIQCLDVSYHVKQLAEAYASDQVLFSPQYAKNDSSNDHVSNRRICPVTGIDITHQQERHRFATTWTLQALFDNNQSAFDRMASAFLSERDRQESRDSQCLAMNNRIKRAVKANRL